MSKRESRSQVWIGRTLQRSPSDSESLRWRDVLQESRAILDRQRERVGYNYPQDTPDCQQNRASVSGYSKTPAKAGSKFERISQKVSTLLKKYSVVPPEHLRNVIPPGHSDFDMDLHNPINDKYYISACAIYQLELNRLMLHEFRQLYECGKPIFYANDLDPFIYYHDRDTSAKFLIDVLKFQFNDDDDKITEFLFNLKTWFNKKGWRTLQRSGNALEYKVNPKINSIAVNGPPNSGKNYFFDTIVAIATNVGHIGRVSNKTNQFSLQDAYNRRLVIGNELSMEDSAKEDFKKLCEGSAFNIRVKHQGDKIFTRTPVIFITNGVLEISGDSAFKNVRLTTMQWRTCPLLAESSMKPYPLALFDVFDYFNVSVFE